MPERQQDQAIEIRSRDDIKAFLEEHPSEASVAIAVRAALRVLPFAADVEASGLRAKLALSMFRAGLVTLRRQSARSTTTAAAAVNTILLDAERFSIPTTVTDAAIATYSAVDSAESGSIYNAALHASLAAEFAGSAAETASAIASFNDHKNYWTQLRFDFALIQRSDPRHLCKSPLWEEQPAWFISKHAKFERILSEQGGSWPLLETWYDQVVENASIDPFPIEALDEIANESPEFWGDGDDNPRTPDIVMDDIAKRLGWPAEPNIPEQRPGIAFGITETGRVGISDSGLLSDDDQKEVESVREVLIEALDDLDAGCAGSNAFGFIQPIASRYRTELTKETVSLDRLYAYGVRLMNASARIKGEIASGYLPEPSVHIGEALDSVLIIHGPMIMGTERGRQLIDRARDYSRTQAETDEYKAASVQMAQIAAGYPNLLEENAAELLTVANAEIAEGDHPQRSSELAETANFNFLRTIGKITTNPTAAIVIGTGTLTALGSPTTGQAMTVAGAALIEACSAFLLAAEPHLRGMIAATGTDLTWVGSLIDWVKRKRK